ncbi:ATP-binding protein [Flavobacterium granuli]|uniref:ACT domain-containing protein n=1 Tax=Flavobacterium granuli TaxID=280093 RepID=A0ABU1S3S4_9FLAO|nr:ATP-binding protein [Flavobacterium granuli]MDR6845678.1 hypothetical protein [Flavobacterium granuli]
MSLVTYEIPNLDDPKNEYDKPQPLSGKSFPYNDLGDRRFEELLYSIYRPKLNSTDFSFDNISLMSGVRDKGRDCSLTKDGINTGLIQCKKYASPLKKHQFAEEITKYILYSLIEKELLPDADNFCYYIAVSSGFSLECSNFIDDFNRLAPIDTDLHKWVAKNIKNPTIASLGIQNVNPLVSEIFSRIKVQKIIPQDLDIMLSQPQDVSLISLFFNVLTVVDNAELIKLQKQLSTVLDPELDLERIKNELQKGSSSLKIEKNEFDDIPDSHIERIETQLLYDWISQPAQTDNSDRQQNICLLAGNAGQGKTVILKDLYDKLTIQGVPVLGLKADKLQSLNLQDLQHKIGLFLPVVEFVDICKEKYEKVVILIDQIDALSQSMSADRHFLDVFKSLIEKFTYDPNVRIIISLRIFDLHYDTSLRVYKNLKTVTVTPLEEEDVLDQLEKLGIQKKQVNAKLLLLLRTPNHLNIFSRIAKSTKNILSVNSLQDLYNELWRIKITGIAHKHPADHKNVKKLLYKIAERMFEFQRISIIETHFDKYAKELSYLESERLIKREENHIQFFHQTFYDFTFSKRFVEKKQKLVDYIKSQEQSILIRSAAKMIFHYLREYNPTLYHATLIELFSDNEIMHHIRHMIFCWLTIIENPSDQEAELVVNISLGNIDFNILFLEHAKSDQWLKIALESNLLDFIINENGQNKTIEHHKKSSTSDRDHYHYQRRCCEYFLASYTRKDNSIVWEFLEGLKDEKILAEVIYHIEKWNNPAAFRILDRCTSFNDMKSWKYLQVLQSIAAFDPLYCLEKMEQYLLSTDYLDNDDIDFQVQSILKTLSIEIPEKMVPLLQKAVLNYLTDSGEETNHYSMVSLQNVDLDDQDTLRGIELYYRILAVCLRNCNEEKSSVLLDFIQTHRYSTSDPLLRLIIYALKSKEKEYKDTIFNLFQHFSDHLLFITSSDLGLEYREIFEVAFPHFDSRKKEKVFSIIKAIKLKNEVMFFNKEKLKYKLPYLGTCQQLLLQRIQKKEIFKDPIMYRNYTALMRKFGNIEEEHHSRNILSSGSVPPISKENFDKMTSDHWISSFKKYANPRDRSNFESAKGGIYEHSRAFQEFCKTEPYQLKLSVIQTALYDSEIDKIYPILGLYSLAESSCDPTDILTVFRQIITEIENEIHREYIIKIAATLIKKGSYDQNTLQLLINGALDFNSVKKYYIDTNKGTGIEGILTKGINSISGTAVSALIHTGIPELENTIFETLEKILQTGPLEVRGFVLYHFAFLNNLNKDRAFKLFVKTLLSENDIHVLASSIWSLQFMTGINFEKLKPVFTKLIQITELGDLDSQWLFSILYFSYLFDRQDAEVLLHELLKFNPYSRAFAVNQISKHYYYNQNSQLKSQSLLMQVLDYVLETDKININYHYMDLIKLRDIYPFLESYVEKDNFELSDGLVLYLTMQCSSFPFQSTKLFNRALQKKESKINNLKIFRRSDDVIKFIAVAFTVIKGNDSKSKQMRHVLLESFNLMLKDYKYRNISEKILEEF